MTENKMPSTTDSMANATNNQGNLSSMRTIKEMKKAAKLTIPQNLLPR